MFSRLGPLVYLQGLLLGAQPVGFCCRPSSVGAINSFGSTLAGCLPATVGFLLCQGEIVSINIIIYWELLGPPRVFLFFPVRTSPVRTSHSCVILSFTSSVRLQRVVCGKFPEGTQGGGSCSAGDCRVQGWQETCVTRKAGWEIAASQCPTGRRQNSR